MPTSFFKFGLRFYFVSYDCAELVHIQVGDNSKKVCKFWLKDNQAILADSSGFTKKELSKLGKVVEENYLLIITTFNEYCKKYKK